MTSRAILGYQRLWVPERVNMDDEAKSCSGVK
jgi:hypothetical protein